jgi:ankyrin repeat protein
MERRSKPTDLSGQARSVADIGEAYEFDRENPKFISLSARDSDDDTLLHRAVFRGNLRDVKDLLDLGADVDAHGDLGHTPLHYAAMQGRPDLVEILLAAGAKHAALNEWGHTPATTAELAGHEEVVRLLRSPRRIQRAISG